MVAEVGAGFIQDNGSAGFSRRRQQPAKSGDGHARQEADRQSRRARGALQCDEAVDAGRSPNGADRDEHEAAFGQRPWLGGGRWGGIHQATIHHIDVKKQ